jgi:hypothetical protein
LNREELLERSYAAQIRTEIRAIQHNSNQQSSWDLQAAQKLISCESTGPLETLIPKKPKTQLYNINIGSFHGSQILFN